MDANSLTIEMKDRKATLSTLWVFVMFAYLYCDVLTNMESEIIKGYLVGQAGPIQVTQGFLLGAAILMEIPIAMVLLSRILKYRANRWANMIAGTIMTVVQFSSLLFGTPPTLHYMFYSAIEIACTGFIVWYTWTWKPAVEPDVAS